VANALNEIHGSRQIAQVLTTLQTEGPANAGNVFRQLRAQGIVTVPEPTRTIHPEDIEPLGIVVRHDGPLPPLSVLFRGANNLRNSYSQQASFGIERELGPQWVVEINYQFANTQKIIRARDINLLQAPLDPRLGIRVWSPAFFRDPILLQENLYESSARASYHGALLQLTKRLSEGLSLSANYTWSKALDDVVDFNADFQGNDQTNLRAERALSSFDQRHRFSLYGLFQAPKREAAGVWGALLSSWALGSIVSAGSGRPFNLLAGFDLNQDRHPTTDRPAFAGRNTGIGPSLVSVSVRVARGFLIRDRVETNFTVEAFNLFNHLNLQGVNNTVGNIPGPFRLRGRHDRGPSEPLGFTSAHPARRLQLGVRLSF
jgi:hypothetical protein